MVEFVTIHKGSPKQASQILNEGQMLTNNAEFWTFGEMETEGGVADVYDGVQLWKKDLGDTNWSEYLIDAEPVKSTEYYPTPTFVTNANGYIYTIVQPTELDSDENLDTIVYLSQHFFGSLDWDNTVLTTGGESYNRRAYPVDKVNYFLDGSSISKFSGATVTEDVFSPYSVPNHITPYGQYLAIAVDLGNQSFCHLWDLDSTTSREFIDFGTGRLRAVGAVSGALFGIVNNSLDNDNLANGNQSFDVRIWQGGS
jgi:hypothetical protein